MSRRGKRSKFWQYATLVLLVLVVVMFYYKGDATSATGKVTAMDSTKVMDKDAAVKKAVNFINTALLQGQATAKVVSSKQENGLYVLKMTIDGRELESYVTLDGKLLFPQGIDLEQNLSALMEAASAAPEQKPVPKSDKPKVEAFVMSHCPYGTQIEKGLIPVMEKLGSKADIEIKFVNYAMHGKKETDEQLQQYCIQKDFNSKFIDYMKCFLEAGDSAACLKKIAVDETKLKKCISDTDTKFNVTGQVNDKSTWAGGSFPPFDVHDAENVKYGVQGSPTLVINGQQASAGRDSASLLKAVCDAFNTAPSECSETLSSASPSPGFGMGTTASATTADAGCGA
jgi:hypothetical protein